MKTCWVVMMENACSWDSWVMTQLSKPFGGYNQAGTGPYREYFLPGQHWSAVELSKPWGPSCRIGRHLCVGFLLAHGTEVTRNALGWLISDATGVCNWYAKLKLHFLDHWASPNFRWGKIQNPYRYDSYFINKHNRAVFEKAFPYIDTRSIPFVIPKDKDRHVKVVAPEVHALIHRYYPPSQPDTKISRAFRMST
ncbi:MAG TPA: hypothetical protein VGX94_00735 [Terriglobia bacterium]|nr:hypothetical protein [Terriglobia bacterium]